MASPVPLTVQSSNSRNITANIVIGSNSLHLALNDWNLYWVVVVDRVDLSVKANFTFTENDQIPPQLNPFLQNTQYILIVTTQMLGSNNLPVGAWHEFLLDEGANVELFKLEQIFEAFNCGTWGNMGYSFVAVSGDDGGKGYESGNVLEIVDFLTLTLLPVEVDGKPMYTPTSIIDPDTT